MRCPFLKETEVESCRCSAVRKMIAAAPGGGVDRKCSSASHADCWIYQQHPPEDASGSGCPYLHRSLAQYCAAASPQKLIPYSESLLSRCGTGRYRYCDLYLMLAEASERTSEPEVDGVRVPRDLEYSPNHMWMQQDEDGACHVGIDGFAARALGTVERITFLNEKGLERPAAVLTARGMDFTMVFPRRMSIHSANLYLRGNPAKLTATPYTLGWLFEGVPAPASAGEAPLIRAPQALEWMRDEVERLSRFAHAAISATEPFEPADGGGFGPGLLAQLGREASLRLFNEFFSPYASWTKSL